MKVRITSLEGIIPWVAGSAFNVRGVDFCIDMIVRRTRGNPAPKLQALCAP
jgi:hypothetical protein